MEEELKKQFKMLYGVMASDEFTDSIAIMYWNLFNRLMAHGFTREEAMDIVTKFNLNQSK